MYPLIAQAPNTRRMIFAACAADTSSLLSATQRDELWRNLHGRNRYGEWWYPEPEFMPQTWPAVEAWYEGLRDRGVVKILSEERR